MLTNIINHLRNKKNFQYYNLYILVVFTFNINLVDIRSSFSSLVSLQDELYGTYNPANKLDQGFQMICRCFDSNSPSLALLISQSNSQLYAKVV